jgi:hypothetical protein
MSWSPVSISAQATGCAKQHPRCADLATACRVRDTRRRGHLTESRVRGSRGFDSKARCDRCRSSRRGEAFRGANTNHRVARVIPRGPGSPDRVVRTVSELPVEANESRKAASEAWSAASEVRTAVSEVRTAASEVRTAVSEGRTSLIELSIWLVRHRLSDLSELAGEVTRVA